MHATITMCAGRGGKRLNDPPAHALYGHPCFACDAVSIVMKAAARQRRTIIGAKSMNAKLKFHEFIGQSNLKRAFYCLPYDTAYIHEILCIRWLPFRPDVTVHRTTTTFPSDHQVFQARRITC